RVGLRPSLTPFATARARINSRSNSASPPSTVRMRRPCTVAVPGRRSRRGHSRKSYDAQEEGESPVDPQEQSVAGFPDHVADFGNGNDSDFVDGDLRN